MRDKIMKTILARLFPLPLCLGSLLIAQSNVIESKAGPAIAPQQDIEAINVRDLYPHRLIGCLGKPLGTRTTIEGVGAEGHMLSNPIAVSGIDGHAIKRQIWIEIRGAVLQKGKQYLLEGYESGAFAGLPAWSLPKHSSPFNFTASLSLQR